MQDHPQIRRPDQSTSHQRATLLAVAFLLLLALFALGSDTSAQDEAAAEAAQQEAQEEALESFVPTEKLPADKAVSFPADI